MNIQPRDADTIVSSWLDDGPTTLPDDVRRSIAVAARTSPQTRARLAWRLPTVNTYLKLGAAAVLAVVLVGGGIALLRSGTSDGPGTAPSVVPSLAPSAAPSGAPASSALPATGPISIADWVAYRSNQYGLSSGHPAGWTVDPATRRWTLGQDAVLDPRSPGMDHFTAPNGQVRASVWTVPVEPGPNFDDRGAFEAWIADFCEATGNTPCTGIADRAVTLCDERRDCHLALLVPFRDDVQAFFFGDGAVEGMTVAAVWRPETDPSVAEYGGSQRLLEAFLATMNVYPESLPFQERQAPPEPSPTPLASPLPALSSTFGSKTYGYRIKHPDYLAPHQAEEAWAYANGLAGFDKIHDRLQRDDGLLEVRIFSTRLPRPMTAEEWATNYAAMPDSGIPADSGSCEGATWSDITIGGQPGRIFEYRCSYVYALTTVGDRGYVFVAAVNTFENGGPWVPLFKEMLATVEFPSS